MALTPEQEWTLIACGMIAHADEILEIGEWDQILRIVDAKLDEDESQTWLDLLMDREKLEQRFADLAPPLPAFNEELLHQCWRMALADGDGSEVEAGVHDHIAGKLGVDQEEAARLREEWTKKAADRAELVVSFAAAMANIDGQLDSAEAVQFDSLLERLPLPVNRRVDLAGILYDAPKLEDVGDKLKSMSLEDREAVLYDIVPLVKASARGERERQAYLQLADLAAVPKSKAEKLLDG